MYHLKVLSLNFNPNGNPNLDTLKKISDIFKGKLGQFPITMNPQQITAFKYAFVTSTEVERSFSVFKYILSDKRQNLTFDNLKILLIQCNRNAE